jgi:hypothetical protein
MKEYLLVAFVFGLLLSCKKNEHQLPSVPDTIYTTPIKSIDTASYIELRAFSHARDFSIYVPWNGYESIRFGRMAKGRPSEDFSLWSGDIWLSGYFAGQYGTCYLKYIGDTSLVDLYNLNILEDDGRTIRLGIHDRLRNKPVFEFRLKNNDSLIQRMVMADTAQVVLNYNSSRYLEYYWEHTGWMVSDFITDLSPASENKQLYYSSGGARDFRYYPY